MSAAITPVERLQQLQARIHEWCGRQFPEQTAETIARHLLEEAGELTARQTGEEAADCLILLLAWAGHTGHDVAYLADAANLTAHIRLTAARLLTDVRTANYPQGTARDLLRLLVAWSILSGVDLLAEAEAKHAVNLARQWRRDADGLHRHVEVQP
jgi:NTP pyrophosphatase (non-canonical NTP hydrolase)